MITTQEIADFTQRVHGWGCLSTEEQENVVSVALERFWKKDQQEKIRKPTFWLLEAAKRIKLEVLRRRREDSKEFAEFCEPWIPDRHLNGKLVEHCVEQKSSQSGHFIAQAERSAACREALESLTTDERQVVELCIEGVKPAEAGRILSIGRSTTKSHWDRARKKLRTNPTLGAIVARLGRVAK